MCALESTKNVIEKGQNKTNRSEYLNKKKILEGTESTIRKVVYINSLSTF